MEDLKTVRTLEIKCLRCSASYRVPVKYCGENILCDTCGVIIVVPSIEELQEPEDPSKQNIQFEALSDETIKIDRSLIREASKNKMLSRLGSSNFITPQLKNKRKRFFIK